MQEIWKDIKGYEGLYQVSNLGNVRSLCFKNSNKIKLLKTSPTNCGYYKVQLYKNGIPKMHYVHRLVAKSFIENPLLKPEVNHLDGNKSNNKVNNLEWATDKENQDHATDTGLRAISPMKGRTGALNPNSRAVIQRDMDGNFIRYWSSISLASQGLGCSPSTISGCLCGRKRTAKGFLWEYA